MHLKKLIYLIPYKECIFTMGRRGGGERSGGREGGGEEAPDCMCIFRTANHPMPARE
jgi:hypothetical protein